MYGSRDGVSHYRQTRRSVDNDDPRHVVTMLLAGAIERIHLAESCLARKDIAAKTQAIGAALDIVDGLRLSLDHKAGGEIAGRLEALYEYMTFRLVEANLRNDARRLQEVAGLLGEIESAWLAISRRPEPFAAGSGFPGGVAGG